MNLDQDVSACLDRITVLEKEILFYAKLRQLLVQSANISQLLEDKPSPDHGGRRKDPELAIPEKGKDPPRQSREFSYKALVH